MIEWTPERIAAERTSRATSWPTPTGVSALDEIERLQARVAELEQLLRECVSIFSVAPTNWSTRDDIRARIRAELGEQT